MRNNDNNSQVIKREKVVGNGKKILKKRLYGKSEGELILLEKKTTD